VLRAGRPPADVETARATLDLLDGRGVCPPERDWMPERLARLRRGLG
jgi:hypothetical protein